MALVGVLHQLVMRGPHGIARLHARMHARVHPRVHAHVRHVHVVVGLLGPLAEAEVVRGRHRADQRVGLGVEGIRPRDVPAVAVALGGARPIGVHQGHPDRGPHDAQAESDGDHDEHRRPHRELFLLLEHVPRSMALRGRADVLGHYAGRVGARGRVVGDARRRIRRQRLRDPRLAGVLDELPGLERRGPVSPKGHAPAVVDHRVCHIESQRVVHKATVDVRVLPILAEEVGQASHAASLGALLRVGVHLDAEGLREVHDFHAGRVHQHPEGPVHHPLRAEEGAIGDLDAVGAVVAVLAEHALPAGQRAVAAARGVLLGPDAAEGAAEAARLARFRLLQVVDLHEPLAPAGPARPRVLQHRGGLVPASGGEAVGLPRPALQLRRLLACHPSLAALRRRNA
eukprot:CAMPEP_0170257096 /NCGR_PEP_ID=MMETSP0116_2-20130129/28403_1 /TAXON_ID=400756 /ORGANISM="Durinskia baltica, Strain CSIRO CS-38" /LENGTH=399 /DNA_ID=CAMNT_0010508109 /DNA_START=63 /DNA_END=1258 /DNA_ORIENTATION=+